MAPQRALARPLYFWLTLLARREGLPLLPPDPPGGRDPVRRVRVDDDDLAEVEEGHDDHEEDAAGAVEEGGRHADGHGRLCLLADVRTGHSVCSKAGKRMAWHLHEHERPSFFEGHRHGRRKYLWGLLEI